MRQLQLFIAAATMITATNVLAQGGTETDSFYCGQSLIEDGTSAEDVLRLCGEPTNRLAEDQWVYNRGPEQLITTVYFEADGTVGRIDQTQLD